MATLMVPFQVTMIPVFLIVKWFGDNVWAGLGIDHIGALMLPNLATAFGIFFLRQFFQTVPVELEEAARVDGTSRLGVLFKIVLPLSLPALSTLAALTFLDVLERLPVAADRHHLAGPDDDPVGAELLPGRPLVEVAAADGGQRDEPAADAARVLRGAAVLRAVGGQHRAEGLTDGSFDVEKGITLAEVEFRDVTRRYPGGVVALNGLNLTVADGEFLILVGPSGCGKSTALRLLAGLDKPTSGEIRIGGTVVNGLAPGERDIAMVFQNYALYPHMSVYRNLAYGLRQRRTPRAEVDRRVRETADLLEIDQLLDRKPGQLSGGQRQRVAMGRALVRKPQAFLLDEPLSNLDAKLRNQVRGDLKRLHRELPVTSIYVTHDQVEAMTLGDRLCVMAGGEVQQIGTTDEIYNRPANTFVAAFMGSPPMNLIPAVVRSGVLHVGGTVVTAVPSPDGPVDRRACAPSTCGCTAVRPRDGARPRRLRRTAGQPRPGDRAGRCARR